MLDTMYPMVHLDISYIDGCIIQIEAIRAIYIYIYTRRMCHPHCHIATGECNFIIPVAHMVTPDVFAASLGFLKDSLCYTCDPRMGLTKGTTHCKDCHGCMSTD